MRILHAALAVTSVVSSAFLSLTLAVTGVGHAAAQVPPKIAFQGILTGSSGKPLPDGTYQVVLRIYDVASGGAALWTEPATGTKPIAVSGGKGLFCTMLGDIVPLGSLAFDKPYFVGVKVGSDPEMAPRVTLASVPYALSASGLKLPYSGSAGAATGSSVFSMSQTAPFGGMALLGRSESLMGAGVQGVNTSPPNGSAIPPEPSFGAGVAGISSMPGTYLGSPPALIPGGPGVYGENNGFRGVGVRASATGEIGIGVLSEASALGVLASTPISSGIGAGGFNYGDDNTKTQTAIGAGVYGYSHVAGAQVGEFDYGDGGAGVYGENPTTGGLGVVGVATGIHSRGVRGLANDVTSYGMEGINSGGVGVYGHSASGTGVYAAGGGAGRYAAALSVYNGNTNGGQAVVCQNSSFWANAHLANTGSGEVLYLQNGGKDADGTGGGDFIRAVNTDESDAQFRVLTTGEVRSDVGFNTPAADFAEMLPAATGSVAGDVLAIGADGRLVKSTEAYQTTLAGVYSTAPGFVGGSPMDGAPSGTVPLAIVGIVPVRVCGENGAIAPGDLLTTSSTPGCAMKATDRTRLTGALLGKALEPFSGDTPGAIRVLLNMK